MDFLGHYGCAIPINGSIAVGRALKLSRSRNSIGRWSCEVMQGTVDAGVKARGGDFRTGTSGETSATKSSARSW